MYKFIYLKNKFYVMDIFGIILRLVITFLLSMLFGIERQSSHKPVGFGTFTFVSLGACTIALLAVSLGVDKSMGILGAAITGIGFLGAGALIKTGDKIFGANTAAAIWLFAIFGLVMGLGQYALAIVAYSLVWATVFFDRYFARQSLGSYQKRITIQTKEIIDEREIESIIGSNCKPLSLEVDKTKNRITFVYLVEGDKKEINSMPKKIFKKDWFESFKIE